MTSARFSRALQRRLDTTILSLTAFLRQEVFCSSCCKLLQFLEQRCDALMTVCFWSTNVIMVWAWMLSSPCALGTRTAVWLGHGCSDNCMLLEHACYYGLGMDALMSGFSWNTSVIMVWAWKHERYYGLGMAAVLTVCPSFEMFPIHY